MHMNTIEKEVSYTIKNTYSTLNNLTPKTKTVWFVFHGLGFLSRYFIKYFNQLNPDENYIIAPQAQAKHYLNGKYTHSGACWLTKENTAFEIENVMAYINQVYASENIPKNVSFRVLGFSQGVSIATRWIAKNNIKCDALYLYAGKIPREFTVADFKQIPTVKLIVGNKDEYITDALIADEKAYTQTIFEDRISYQIFNGTHVVDKKIINSLV